MSNLGASGWKKVLIYGMGLSGRAAARLLRREGVAIVAVDSRPESELDLGGLAADPGIEWILGSDPDSLPAQVDAVVVSPGVSPDRPLLSAAAEAGLPVIAEVELAFRYVNGPLIGITGSNGKSTTTALTAELLRASGFEVEVCGNIGVPLSDVVQGGAGRVFVTELSSFQLEKIDKLRPVAGALLNISPDHLDRHATVDEYGAMKARLFSRQEPSDVAVLNADDPIVAAVRVRARRRFFSRRDRVTDGCYLAGEQVLEVSPGEPARELFAAGDLSISGLHNLENAMAAALLARAVGAETDRMRIGLTSFRGLPHRLQLVAEVNGVRWFDDSKGTNVGATKSSLEGFSNRSVHLVLGGRSKGADPAALRDLVGRKVLRLYLIGESAELFRDALAGAAPVEICGEMAAAVRAAAAHAQDGESVLLSPACASFDQYGNFSDRGRHFQRLVEEHVGG